MYPSATESEKVSAYPSRVFSLAEIQSATKDFDEELVIGHGGFGKVYKGQISSEEGGHAVAIKRLDSMSSQGELEFRAEIETLSKLRHCHLVSLIGYCDDKKELIVVYEYMANGTLYHHLHKAESPLNWVQRIKIAIGAGRGLDYLHTGVGTRHGIIHRDVKSSNILLDENWEALISDFGLSKIGPTNQSSSYVDASVKGTFGYLDPEYFYTRKLTRKTDVFAFGVVLFELLSGRLPVDIRHGEEQCSLVRWAKKCVKERKLDQMVDSKITGKIFPKCLRKFTQIAYECLRSDPTERPTIAEVVVSLQGLLELQQKHDNSANSTNSLGRMGLTLKIHKYFNLVTKENSDQSTSSSTNMDDVDQGEMPHQDGGDHGERPYQHRDLKIFSCDELERASRDFRKARLDNWVYGAVYKGWVDKLTYSPCKHDTGLPIAIKRLDSYNRSDLDMLKEFCHPSIVKLVGYCVEKEKLFVVHEFMSKGDLKALLSRGNLRLLPLVTKVKIVVGIAQAFLFMHKTPNEVRANRCGHGTVGVSLGVSQLHRCHILLDENFTPKLSYYYISKRGYGFDPTGTDFGYNYHGNSGEYYPGFEPFQLLCNLSGFRVVLGEVLTGIPINNVNELTRMDSKWHLHELAGTCLEMCSEVNAESKMLTFLEKTLGESGQLQIQSG